MGMLDDSAIFTAVIQQGGFSRAAKYLGISNGLVSRRITQLEMALGVSLMTRTTRELRLTPEGELFFQHALRIQQEMDLALSHIHSSAKKPTGMIAVSAPPYFGRHYLTPIILKFLSEFPEIKIDLRFSNDQIDLIKEQVDLVIRGAGFISKPRLQDSSMQMKFLLKEKIGLYASPAYFHAREEPKQCDELSDHALINFSNQTRLQAAVKWPYLDKKLPGELIFEPALNTNDVESCLDACIAGFGIGRFTELNIKVALQQKQVRPILEQYDWGAYHLFAIYPLQQTLPERSRLLLDFIFAHTKNLVAHQN